MHLTLFGCWLSTLQPHLGIVLVIARGDEDIGSLWKTIYFRMRGTGEGVFRVNTLQLKRLITCRANLATKDKLGSN